MNKNKTKRCRLIILAGWLCAWQILSLICGNSILMVGPLETAVALGKNIVQLRFWQTVLSSYARILVGLLAGTGAGILLAAAGYRYKIIEEICQPFMTLIKAIPVASFTVLLLIWWGSAHLATAICLLVVLPHIYINTLEGLKATDKELLEMAQVFKLPVWNRFFYIYRPALRPFLESSLKISIGMAWKSGVAAEVIGTPDFSIGERLYLSKIYLNTADVLAWTAVTIGLSVVTEKLFCKLLRKGFGWEPGCKRPEGRTTGNSKPGGREPEHSPVCLKAEHICKSYHVETVLQDYSCQFLAGERYYFRTPSGSGKTTLFRILAGLELPDRGSVFGQESTVMMFQEDRLCREYSAVKNVEMVTGDSKAARLALEKLLPADTLDKPVSQLSGGMCRRVALVRTFAADSNCCLLDEPFTGLDEENITKAAQFIAEVGRDKAILIASHNKVQI